MPSIGAPELVILALLMLAAPPILLVGLFYTVSGAQTFVAGDMSAEEVLRRRYAGGEISREEYQNIREDITREQNA